MLAGCANLENRDVDLHLQKFNLQPPTITLAKKFEALGMKTAFDKPKGSANFDKIAPRTPTDYLYISQIFHKTFIAVDEKGTEAAAARSEEHTSELQSQSNIVCRLLLEKKMTATATVRPCDRRRRSPRLPWWISRCATGAVCASPSARLKRFTSRSPTWSSIGARARAAANASPPAPSARSRWSPRDLRHRCAGHWCGPSGRGGGVGGEARRTRARRGVARARRSSGHPGALRRRRRERRPARVPESRRRALGSPEDHARHVCRTRRHGGEGRRARCRLDSRSYAVRRLSRRARRGARGRAPREHRGSRHDV